MLICVEGCIGIGKTTLALNLAHRLSCEIMLEEYTNNPFLSDFYAQPIEYALQVQTTFLFLQDRTMRRSSIDKEQKDTIADFYPSKSLVFGKMILPKDDLFIVETIFGRLFNKYPFPNLLIYLTADIDIILQRIHARNDVFTRNISQDYLRNLVEQYDKFFNSYIGTKLHINTNNLDLRASDSSDMNLVISEIKKILEY